MNLDLQDLDHLSYVWIVLVIVLYLWVGAKRTRFLFMILLAWSPDWSFQELLAVELKAAQAESSWEPVEVEELEGRDKEKGESSGLKDAQHNHDIPAFEHDITTMFKFMTMSLICYDMS